MAMPPAPVDPSGLDVTQKELRLLMEIDQVRDSARDPTAMLGALLTVVADEFSTDVALLFVIEPDTQVLELRAVNDRGGLLAATSTEALDGLARQGLTARTVAVTSKHGLGGSLADVQAAVVPIIMGETDRLGTLLLLRSSHPFDDAEVEALTFLESQLDSALVQARRLFELDLRNRELETIYRVDRLRDEHLPFDEMLSRVLEELRREINADVAFIMLYDGTGQQLEMRAVSYGDLAGAPSAAATLERAANTAVAQAERIHWREMEGEVGSVLCVPLILRDEVLGVFGLARRRTGGFGEADRRLLSAIASQMDTAIFESLEQRRLRQVLGRSVDPAVMERLLTDSDVDFLRGERQVLTVLYGDLRGSTRLAEALEPEDLLEFVNEYLGTMSDVILAHGATLDKFVGDEVMALFGAPYPMEDHALRAIRVGLDMQEKHRATVARWKQRGIEPCPMGIGIATGELIVGEMGSARRSDYTVIGRAANLGARICGRALAEQVLISAATYDLVADRVTVNAIEGLQFKGVSANVTIYEVTGLR